MTAPDRSCPACRWAVPADSAASADELCVVIDPRRDEVQVRGARLGVLHSCPAAGLPRDADGAYVRP